MENGSGSPATPERMDSLIRLLTCTDIQCLLDATVEAAIPGASVRVAALYRMCADGQQIELVTSTGFADDTLNPYRLLSLSTSRPLAEAVRERRAVFSSAADFPRAALETHGRTLQVPDEFVSLPLIADGECLGAIILLLPASTVPSSVLLNGLRAAATACAHRWQRLLAMGKGGADGEPEAGPREGDGELARTTRNPLAPPSTPVGHPVDGAGSVLSTETPPAGRLRVSMLELAMAHARIGSFDWDFISGRMIWDDRLRDLFGIAPEDFDGRATTLLRSVHPDDRAMVDAAVEESRTSGRYHVVYRIIRDSDRTVRWLDTDGRVVYDQDGTPQGMIGVTQDRTGELERESAREARKDFVLTVTRGLSAALTIDDILAVILDTALPALGSVAQALYLREDGGTMRLIAAQGFDSLGKDRLQRAASAASPLVGPLRQGVPMFLETREEYLRRMPGEDLRPEEGHQACALLPLTSADGLVGTWVVIYDQPRVFSPDDRTVLTATAGIVGQSLARARLHDTTRQYLTELQRLMLPRTLPQVTGLDIAARYQPGSEGLEVGGDWYDVLPMPGGRVALVIGDVQGHNARAAAVMGQLRTTMRTYAVEEHSPALMMERADRMLCHLDTDLFATCCIAEIDPATGRVRLVRAGHPHPLLLGADGRVTEVRVPGGIPLGTFPDASPHPVTETTLEPGAALLLYTDGLAERPGIDYAEGVAEISERLAWWSGARGGPTVRLESVADRVVPPVSSRVLHDDIAVLLVRRAPLEEPDRVDRENGESRPRTAEERRPEVRPEGAVAPHAP